MSTAHEGRPVRGRGGSVGPGPGTDRGASPRDGRRFLGALAAVLLGLLALVPGAAAQDAGAADRDAGAADRDDAAVDAAPSEADHYEVVDIPIPEGLVLEVGGLLVHSDGALYVCTRRGDLWRVSDPYGEAPGWQLWADGLAEPLGLLEDEDGSILLVQRSELTRLSDLDGDGRADLYETVSDDWPTSGDYHEYAFGPARDGDGRLWLTLNRPFGQQAFGPVDWRGWAMRLDDDGELVPACAGLRSPAGVTAAPWGEVFYTDNQGEWCGASKLSLLEEGRFHGHPWGMESAKLERSRVAYPGPLPDGALMPLAARVVPGFALPAIWFPYDVMGRSPSGFVWDRTEGAFGPFAGQVFVGDQYQASVLRVALEQVDGTWQGACFPFRKGLASGVIRVAFGADGSLVVGSSDRGWPSLGSAEFGLQRLVHTGRVPFEMHSVRLAEDGFTVRFTEPVDRASAGDPESWELERFTYRLHSTYGSDETDTWPLPVTAVSVDEDGLSARLTVEGLRQGYVHGLTAAGVRSIDGRPLLHDQAFYTLMDLRGEAPADRAVIAVDAGSRSAGEALAGMLRAEGLAVKVVDPHAAPGGLAVLRDASLAVLLTGDLLADGPDAEALLRYADGGHGLVAVGAGLRPLWSDATEGADDEPEDPWFDEDDDEDEDDEAGSTIDESGSTTDEGGLPFDPDLAGPWLLARLAGAPLEAADGAGAVLPARATDEGAEHPLLSDVLVDALPADLTAGPLAVAADDPDAQVLLRDGDGAPLLWLRGGERQRLVGLAADPGSLDPSGLLTHLAAWAARLPPYARAPVDEDG